MTTLTSRQEKINKVVALVNENPKIDFDPETTTFTIVPCNCTYATDFDKVSFADIMYNINSYILEKNYQKNYEIKLLGNFGSFIMRKLQELTKDNPKLVVLENGEIDIPSARVTIKINLFEQFKIILQHINQTIQDAEKHHHVKIGTIKYLNNIPVKSKKNGKRSTRSTN